MGRQHGGAGRGSHPARAIATVHDAGPRNLFAHTVLTHAPIAEESGRWTEQAEIMQSLHHWNAFLVGGVVSGWRDDRKGVVDVHDVRLFPLHQSSQLVVDFAIP